MIDLIKLGDKTYCLKNPVNIGIYLLDETNVCVIDSGNSKQFGKIIDSVLEENSWNLKCIINTHSHADHIGGNKYLQDKYNCKIYANKVESYFINDPILEPSMMYGAVPLNDLKHPLLFAESSICDAIENFREEGIRIINLEGHSYGLIGVVTSDDVCFVGDAYTSTKILEKYAIQYVFDVEKYLKTLEYLKSTNFKVYVPSHGEIENNPQETLDINKEVVLEISDRIISIIGSQEITFDDLLKELFEIYHIGINVVQYYLIGATIKSFLVKLVNENKVELIFRDNIMKIKNTSI